MNEIAKNFSNRIDDGNKLLDRLEESLANGDDLSKVIDIAGGLYINSKQLLGFEESKQHVLYPELADKFTIYTNRATRVAKTISDTLSVGRRALKLVK